MGKRTPYNNMHQDKHQYRINVDVTTLCQRIVKIIFDVESSSNKLKVSEKSLGQLAKKRVIKKSVILTEKNNKSLEGKE